MLYLINIKKESNEQAKNRMFPFLLEDIKSCKKHEKSDIEAKAIYNTETGPILK
jgi:hypothetical protein